MARNKKYNPRKNLISKVQRHTHDHALVFVQGIEHTLTYNRKTQIIQYKIDRLLFEEVNHTRHKWHITMAVLGLNQYGSEVIVWDELSVDSPVLQQDLAVILGDSHQDLLTTDEVLESMTEVLRFAWIATPSASVLSDDTMYSIFKRLRGFQHEIFPNSSNDS